MGEYIRPIAAFVNLINGTPPSSSGLDEDVSNSVLLSPLYRGAVYEDLQVRFFFTRILTGPEEAALDVVVSLHDGVDADEAEEAQDLEGSPLINVTTINGLDFPLFSVSTVNHISNETNPHGTSIGNLENGTLAELNAKISDATLDTSTSLRPPTAHASQHNRTGSDPLKAQDLSSGSINSNQILSSNGTGGWTLTPLPVVINDHGNLLGLGDDDHPQYLRADGGRSLAGTLNAGGNAITNVGLVDGVDISTQAITTNTHITSSANPHSTDLGNLGTGTLAELNSKVTDATLDNASDPRDPNAHASTHNAGATDEILVQALGSGTATAGQIFIADGSGGVEVSTPSGVDEIPVFSGYISSSQADLTSAYVALPLNAENAKDTNVFTHLGSSAEVTVLTAGLYSITGYCTVTMSNNSRSQSSFRVTVSTGGGFSQVPGLFGIMYHRTSDQNGNSASASQAIQLPVGATLRVELRRDAGSGILSPTANGCGLIIQSLEGLRGPQGIPGNGASLEVLEGSTSRGSFEQISFENSSFNITDQGSGQVLVEEAPKASLQTVSDTTVTQTSTSFIILQTLTVPNASNYYVNWGGLTTCTPDDSVFYKLFINGVEQVGSEARFTQTSFVTSTVTLPISYVTGPIAANSTLSIRWRVSGGTGVITDRRFLVLER